MVLVADLNYFEPCDLSRFQLNVDDTGDDRADSSVDDKDCQPTQPVV